LRGVLQDGAETISDECPMSIRVLVADDSIFMRTALTRMIESDPGLTVVGTATHGLEALEKAVELDPDVVTLDLDMPRLDGLKTLRRMMQESPRPVIVVSALSQAGAEAMLTALDTGAFDCIGKPTAAGHLDIVRIREDLVAKVKAAAAATWLRCKPVLLPAPVGAESVAPGSPEAPEVIAIGASTGGPLALQRILSQLPGDLPAGILIVQHMPRGFTDPFARRLNSLSRLRVREAVANDVVEPGVALLAPAGMHLAVCRRGGAGNSGGRVIVRLSDQPSEARHIPSVDVMMMSVAETYGAHAMGVLLTGMGTDGARGIKEIHDRGGFTVGQDEASCAVYGMPRAAAELGALSRVAALHSIADEIVLTAFPAAAPVVIH
jgi:two-component system chemotaxis response regulator CheB